MQVIPAVCTETSLEVVLRDYRQRHSLSEGDVLNTLMEALASRRARAFLAVHEGQTVGAVIVSRQGEEGLIHLLHTLPEAPTAEAALLDRAEQELVREGGLTRIAATLALLPESSLEELFRERGYRVISRARMVLRLEQFEHEAVLPVGYRLVPWRSTCLSQAVALVRTCHLGSEDIIIHPEVVSASGARRLLGGIVGGEFGTFDPAFSPVILADKTLVGLCLAVWHIALPREGFILDLCVDVAHRRRGLGRALVVAAALAFRQAGAHALGLAVTLSNQSALQLYEGLGFGIEQRFGVLWRQV